MEYKNKIKSLSEFVEEIGKINHQNSDENYYFRGESEIFTKRVPTLYRDKKLTLDGSSNYYKRLINDLGISYYQNSDELGQMFSVFQHNQAKTRILDITSNPMVALFFAVSNYNLRQSDFPKKDLTGKVYCFKQTINSNDGKYIDNYEKYEGDYTIAIKNALNFIPQYKISAFIDFCMMVEECSERNSEFIDDFRSINLEGEPFFNRLYQKDILSFFTITDMKKLIIKDIENHNILPPNLPSQWNYIDEFMYVLNKIVKLREKLIYPMKIYQVLSSAQIFLSSKKSDRIRNQKGAFIFPSFPCEKMLSQDQLNNKKFECFQQQVADSIDKLEATELSISIRHEYKEKIYNNLKVFGFTKSFIYPGIETNSIDLLED